MTTCAMKPLKSILQYAFNITITLSWNKTSNKVVAIALKTVIVEYRFFYCFTISLYSMVPVYLPFAQEKKSHEHKP